MSGFALTGWGSGMRQIEETGGGDCYREHLSHRDQVSVLFLEIRHKWSQSCGRIVDHHDFPAGRTVQSIDCYTEDGAPHYFALANDSRCVCCRARTTQLHAGKQSACVCMLCPISTCSRSQLARIQLLAASIRQPTLAWMHTPLSPHPARPSERRLHTYVAGRGV